MMMAFWQGEITNPLLSVYDVLMENGYDEKKTRPLIYTFGVAFTFFRVMVCPYFFYKIFNSQFMFGFKAAVATLCKVPWPFSDQPRVA